MLKAAFLPKLKSLIYNNLSTYEWTPDKSIRVSDRCYESCCRTNQTFRCLVVVCSGILRGGMIVADPL